MKKAPVDFCPVPSEQQPVNEYKQLEDSWFFRWATLKTAAYSRKLTCIWLGGWLLIGPIAAASFPLKKDLLPFIVSSVLGVTALLSLVLLRLYLGWAYICDRLKAEKVFYEESGWYDGQIWIKTPEIITRDRLIVSYQIKPILTRLKQTLLILGIIIGISGLLWFLL